MQFYWETNESKNDCELIEWPSNFHMTNGLPILNVKNNFPKFVIWSYFSKFNECCTDLLKKPQNKISAFPDAKVCCYFYRRASQSMHCHHIQPKIVCIVKAWCHMETQNSRRYVYGKDKCRKRDARRLFHLHNVQM